MLVGLLPQSADGLTQSTDSMNLLFPFVGLLLLPCMTYRVNVSLSDNLPFSLSPDASAD